MDGFRLVWVRQWIRVGW